MRSVLALGLLIALCASAGAAPARHPRTHHHTILRHSYNFVPPPVHYDDTPGYHDPSRFGGGAP